MTHLTSRTPSPMVQPAPMTDSLMLHCSPKVVFSATRQVVDSTRELRGIRSGWAILSGWASEDVESPEFRSGSLASSRDTWSREGVVSTRLMMSDDFSGCL